MKSGFMRWLTTYEDERSRKLRNDQEIRRRIEARRQRPRRESYDNGAVERWVNWTIGSLLVALLLSHLH